jgi:hypothetical protein
MIVGVRHLPLQHELKEMNSAAIKNMNRENFYNVARQLNLSPDSRIVRIIYDAITKGVKILKTKDQSILAYSAIIQLKFGIKVISS